MVVCLLAITPRFLTKAVLTPLATRFVKGCCPRGWHRVDLRGKIAPASLKHCPARYLDGAYPASPGQNRPGLIEASVSDLSRSSVSLSPGQNRPGLIEADGACDRAHTRAHLRGKIAPASLKRAQSSMPNATLYPSPGQNRPGLIEARFTRSWSCHPMRSSPGQNRPGLIEARLATQ